MNTPWIIGLILAVAFFAYFEKRAFDFPNSQNTLSRAIYNIGQSWPLSIWIMGLFAGSLATHFFWHFCPPGSLSTGWNVEQIQVYPTSCLRTAADPTINFICY
jgi:hypothetical protein